MGELRRDPLTGRRVLFASGRIARPHDFYSAYKASPPESCPFCPGHEDQTPPETWAIREGEPDTPGWRIRAVPNKYPICEAHELIIETPRHDVDLPDLSPTEVEAIIAAYRSRMEALAEQGRWRYLALFKNHGHGAGASRAHPHAQLMGLEFVPPLVREELRIARRAYRKSGRCIYCETIEHELEFKERVIEADERFFVWSPYAARVPLECWILPRRHQHDFLNISAEDAAALACVLQRALARLTALLKGPLYAYNYYLHTSPLAAGSRKQPEATVHGYHWHLELLPRLGRLAGLEWGTGLYVNSVTPEEAARRLRAAL